VAIGAGTSSDWTKLLKVIEREDLTESREFMSPAWRIENNAAVDAVIEQWTGSRATSEIIELLDRASITCGPIRTIEEVIAWEHLHARNMLQPVRNPKLPNEKGPLAAGFPLKFSGADVGHEARVPMPGEHNHEIYRDLLSLSQDEVERLARQKVI
jgi:crotonobetainyl-CoA:carnitine CoA-transferase CaiB-like acyl-CoA transferase